MGNVERGTWNVEQRTGTRERGMGNENMENRANPNSNLVITQNPNRKLNPNPGPNVPRFPFPVSRSSFLVLLTSEMESVLEFLNMPFNADLGRSNLECVI